MSMFNNDYSTVSNLFGSLSTGGSTDTILSDYASLKNGSYRKLLKAYYKEMRADSSDDASSTESSDKASSSKQTSADKKSVIIKDAMSALAESVDKLSDPSLYEKKKISKTDEDGNTTEVEDYDRDAIYEAVSSFVENYNAAINAAADNGSDRVLRQTLNMQGATNKNLKMLAKIGVTIGKDNKLSVDKETLEKADIGSFKSMFGTSGSYGATVSSKASLIYQSASLQATTKSTYSSDGNYLDKLLNGNLYTTKI